MTISSIIAFNQKNNQNHIWPMMDKYTLAFGCVFWLFCKLRVIIDERPRVCWLVSLVVNFWWKIVWWSKVDANNSLMIAKIFCPNINTVLNQRLQHPNYQLRKIIWCILITSGHKHWYQHEAIWATCFTSKIIYKGNRLWYTSTATVLILESRRNKTRYSTLTATKSDLI